MTKEVTGISECLAVRDEAQQIRMRVLVVELQMNELGLWRLKANKIL